MFLPRCIFEANNSQQMVGSSFVGELTVELAGHSFITHRDLIKKIISSYDARSEIIIFMDLIANLNFYRLELVETPNLTSHYQKK